MKVALLPLATAPRPVSTRSRPPLPADASSVALTSTLRCACNNSVLPLLQVMGALTKMSPLPLPVATVCTVALPLASWPCSVPASAVSTVMSVGSMSQWPACTVVPGCTFTCAAEVSMKPPAAFSVPPTFSVPWAMSPIKKIWPFSPVARALASMLPLWLMAAVASVLAALAVRYTRPPSARMAPPCSIRASSAPCATSIFTGPPRSSVTRLPAPISTWPWGAVMLPVLTMRAAISATVPPAVVLMSAWLMMLPLLLPSNFRRPAMKSAWLMPRVLATRPPTFTCAPGANSTPFGFTKNTWPVLVSLPKIWLASVPSTRFSVAPPAGWLKCTCALAPMLKLCQSMAARAVLCTMSMRGPCVAILAAPPTTWPPLGRAVVGGPAASAGAAIVPSSAASAAATVVWRVCEGLPRVLAFSCVTTQA